jgi:hypothetical protein
MLYNPIFPIFGAKICVSNTETGCGRFVKDKCLKGLMNSNIDLAGTTDLVISKQLEEQRKNCGDMTDYNDKYKTNSIVTLSVFSVLLLSSIGLLIYGIRQ